MRHRLTIILGILLVLGLLIALNFLSYEPEGEMFDSEFSPNRSTYHAGPTGARAFYELLNESGLRVMRWREDPAKLLGATGQKIDTFVVIGTTLIPFGEDEIESLLLWVDRGGTLVLIDRRPERGLLRSAGSWAIVTDFKFYPPEVDPDAADVTAGVTPYEPSQPTSLTADVAQVLPSRLATSIKFPFVKPDPTESEGVGYESDADDLDPPPSVAEIDDSETQYASPAPVAHLNDADGALLVDWVRGQGRVVLLSDPYIVSNTGISHKDNLQLALNMVTGSDGLIAFDEYHHGRGVTENAFVGYFSGTPVIPMVAQLVLLLLLMVYTGARRFARPLPWHEVDRRSTLEFVASMAELQHRARAFGLAIENIYGRSRRALARNAGLEYNSPRSEIARRVAQRFSMDPQQIESVMRECEQTINGERISDRRSLQLVRQLRTLERKLRLQRR